MSCWFFCIRTQLNKIYADYQLLRLKLTADLTKNLSKKVLITEPNQIKLPILKKKSKGLGRPVKEGIVRVSSIITRRLTQIVMFELLNSSTVGCSNVFVSGFGGSMSKCERSIKLNLIDTVYNVLRAAFIHFIIFK